MSNPKIVGLVVALLVALVGAQAVAQGTFTVTGVCCDHYDIDGQPNPTLTVVRGQAYDFNLFNAAFHPFNIQSTAGFGGTPYPNVARNGATDGTVTLTVPILEAANILFYQCGNHIPMNGVINVIDAPIVSTPTATPTWTVTITPTSTPTPTATRTPTSTATGSPTATPTGTATQTSTRTRTATATPSPTATATHAPTPTPTSTATSPPTPTPAATGTPTPTAAATPTPTPSCSGDCNSDRHVTVDEILTMVNIALGNSPLTDCSAGDGNRDGQVTVDEILTAVNNALNGCVPFPSPTAGPQQVCVNSGGTVSTALCCLGVGDFPNTCGIGACGCSPTSSHELQVCTCASGKCFGGAGVGCVAR